LSLTRDEKKKQPGASVMPGFDSSIKQRPFVARFVAMRFKPLIEIIDKLVNSARQESYIDIV